VCLSTFFFNKQIAFSLLIALLVWSVWFILGGQFNAISNIVEHWQIALTMAFGSFIAGATSEGGGAIAFPIFTKVLHIPPKDAKIFSLAIQSVGMTAASLVILFMKIKLEWRAIQWASLGGLPGIAIGTLWLAQYLPPEIIRITFTVIVSSFAVALFIMNRHFRQCNQHILYFTWKEKNILFLAGFIGGLISGLVGNGIDIITFSVIVILFRVSEKIATPTSVLLMAINAVVGFTIHLFIIEDFTPEIKNYWLAAIPVVVVGAPIGAIFCSLLNRQIIAWLLIAIITIELITSLYIIPLTQPVILYSLSIFLCFFYTYYQMSSSLTYLPKLKKAFYKPKILNRRQPRTR